MSVTLKKIYIQQQAKLRMREEKCRNRSLIISVMETYNWKSIGKGELASTTKVFVFTMNLCYVCTTTAGGACERTSIAWVNKLLLGFFFSALKLDN